MTIKRAGCKFSFTMKGNHFKLYKYQNDSIPFTLLFDKNLLKIFSSDILESTFITDYVGETIEELLLIEVGIQLLILHKDHAPAHLVRDAAKNTWSLSNILM